MKMQNKIVTTMFRNQQNKMVPGQLARNNKKKAMNGNI